MIKQGFTTSARKHLKEKKPKPSKYKVRPNGYGNRKTHNKFNQSEEVTVAKDECSDEFLLSAMTGHDLIPNLRDGHDVDLDKEFGWRGTKFK